jgi:hypothetical protein
MRPVHVGLLVAAAALGGALFMKVVTHKPEAASTQSPPAVTQQQPIPAEPVTAQQLQAPAAEPAPPPPAAVPEKPVAKAAAKPAMTRNRLRNAGSKPEVAQNLPPAQPQAPAPAAQPAPAASTPATPEPEPQRSPAADVLREAIATPAPPPPPPNKVTLPVGTMLQVRLVEALSTDRNASGDTFTATLDQPISAEGFVIAERGAKLEGKIVDLKESGKTKGLAQMGIALTRLRTSDGQTIPISTDTFTKVAPSTVKRDVGRGAAATGIGAAIGAIAGGGKGAGIGAAIGAAAGVGGALATRGDPAKLATETRLTFRLSDPVTITEKRK